MKEEIKNLGQSQLEIIITVPAVTIEPFLVKAATKLAQTAKIEGFRPGKAPYEIVVKKFGAMAILQEALDDIIADSYEQVIKENKIVAIGQPEITLEKIAPDNDLVYKAKVSVLPQVKLGDYQKIKIKRSSVKISAEKVAQVIKEIQNMRAKQSLVDRPAQTGDQVEIDFTVSVGGVAIENGSQKKYPVIIGEKRFIPGFEEQLVGLKSGDNKDFKLKFPENYQAKNLAGQEAEFKVSVVAVYSRELPSVDDQLAQEISGQQFKTVAELKENIEKNLQTEEATKQEQALEVELLDKIIASCEFEPLPEMLLASEAHKMIHELEDSISHQGLNFSDYLKHLNKTEVDLEKEFRPQAAKRVKAAIIMREIYQAEKMAVTDDEIKKEVEEAIKQYPNNPEAEKQFNSELYKDYLKNILGNRKVMEYLKKIIITE